MRQSAHYIAAQKQPRGSACTLPGGGEGDRYLVPVVSGPVSPRLSRPQTMTRTALWPLLAALAAAAVALDLSTVRIPPGLDLRKIQNLMKVVDPKSCGCARPDQHCEVPVPEAKFVGFSCRVGTFCCRYKKQRPPGAQQQPLNIRTIPQTLAEVMSAPGPRPGQRFTQTRQAPAVALPRKDTVAVIERPRNVTRQAAASAAPRPRPQRPVFDPREKKRVVTKDNLEPHDLGIPKVSKHLDINDI